MLSLRPFQKCSFGEMNANVAQGKRRLAAEDSKPKKENKFCGLENGASGRTCPLDWKKQSPSWFVRGGVGGVAMDVLWHLIGLRSRELKPAMSFQSIIWTKKKTLKQESGRKEPFLHPFLFAWSTSVTKKAYFLLNEKEKGEEIILSVTEVRNVQSCSTLPLHHYFIRGDAFLSDVRHIMNAGAFNPTRKHAIN